MDFNFNYVLFAIGLLLVSFACLLLFQKVVAGETKIEMFGIKASSPFAAIIPFALGALLLVPAGRDIVAGQKLRVVDAQLRRDGLTGPDTGTNRARCPVSVTLDGTITTNGHSGTVSYRFIRKDGAFGREDPTDATTISLGSSDSADVQDVVWVTPPEGQFYISDVLEVIDPGSRRSDPVGFTVICDQSALPPPPNIPPPPDLPGP